MRILTAFEAAIEKANADGMLNLSQDEKDAALFTLAAWHLCGSGSMDEAASYLAKAEIFRQRQARENARRMVTGR